LISSKGTRRKQYSSTGVSIQYNHFRRVKTRNPRHPETASAAARGRNATGTSAHLTTHNTALNHRITATGRTGVRSFNVSQEAICSAGFPL
jgi:hypothetical protein